jgi:hypothetical protein
MTFKSYAWNRLKLAYIEFLRVPYRSPSPTGGSVIVVDKYLGDDDTEFGGQRHSLYRTLPGHTRISTIEKTSHTDTYEGLYWWDLLRHAEPRDRFIVYYTLVLGYNRTEVAEMLGISGSRAERLFTRALYRLFDPAVAEANSY